MYDNQKDESERGGKHIGGATVRERKKRLGRKDGKREDLDVVRSGIGPGATKLRRHRDRAHLDIAVETLGLSYNNEKMWPAIPKYTIVKYRGDEYEAIAKCQ